MIIYLIMLNSMERVEKKTRRIIAINPETGERVIYKSAYDLAKQAGVSSATVFQSLDRGGAVLGWKVYDTPETIREKIRELEERIKMLEA